MYRISMFDPEHLSDEPLELTDEIMEVEHARVHDMDHDMSPPEGHDKKQEKLQQYQPPKGWKDKKAA